MNEQSQDAFEERTRALFQDSVEGLDYSIRSRLTQARSAALEAAAHPRSWFLRRRVWTPAAGVTAVAVLAMAVWMEAPLMHPVAGVADARPNLEDLDLLASTDESSGDAVEMLQDDIDFYEFADSAANPGSES